MEIRNPSPDLYNEDLAPARTRNWGAFSIFNVWTSDVHSLWGYYLAASLFLLCGTFVNFVVAIGLGSLVIFFLMTLVGNAGVQDRRSVSGARTRVVRHLGRQPAGAGARDRRVLLVRRADRGRVGRDRRAADAQRRDAWRSTSRPISSATRGSRSSASWSSGRCSCSSSSAAWRRCATSRTGPARRSGS